MSLIDYSELAAPLVLVAYCIGFAICAVVAVALTVDWYVRQQGATRYEARLARRQSVQIVSALCIMATAMLLMYLYW